MPNLLTLDDLSPADITQILEKAAYYKTNILALHQKAHHLQNRVVANLFFETSTRTLNSFILAEQTQAMTVLTPDLAQSALQKGESIIDTLKTFEAMGVAAFVIRSKDEQLLHLLTEMPFKAHFINAGIGCRAHPTQALIDLSVILKHFADLKGLRIAIVGDVKHSRVAQSQIKLFNKMGMTDIRLIAPESLHLENSKDMIYESYTDIDQGLKGVDIIIRLRLQKERLPQTLALDYDQFKQNFLITKQKLALAKPNALLMHPGPCMVDEDIEAALMSHPQNVILEQVSHSVAVRMACLDYVFNSL